MSCFMRAFIVVGIVGCGARSELYVAGHLDAATTDVVDAPIDAANFPPLLATDGRHACYRQRSGTLLCWGASPNGLYASDGGFLTMSTPQPVMTNGVPSVVSAHLIGQCILLDDGTVDCWGYDDEFQRLGDGTGVSQPPPGVPVFNGATDLIGSPHGDFECAHRADNSLYCWGYPPDCDITYPDGGYPITPVARPDLASLSGLALGQQFLCGIQNSSVYCCGWQNSGDLGNGVDSVAYHDSLGVVALPSKATQVVVGGSYACAILDDMTAWCWGWNSEGQVGDGTMGVDRATPVQVVGLVNAVQLDLGIYHSCARLADGTARCWGNNDHGQIGDATTTQRLTPTPVVAPSGTGTLSDIVDLHTGYDFSCALIASGDVYCWGWNNNGQVGDGTMTDRSIPTKVIGLQ